MWELLNIGFQYKNAKSAGKPGFFALIGIILFGIFFEPISSVFRWIGVTSFLKNIGLLNEINELNFIMVMELMIMFILFMGSLYMAFWIMLMGFLLINSVFDKNIKTVNKNINFDKPNQKGVKDKELLDLI